MWLRYFRYRQLLLGAIIATVAGCGGAATTIDTTTVLDQAIEDITEDDISFPASDDWFNGSSRTIAVVPSHLKPSPSLLSLSYESDAAAGTAKGAAKGAVGSIAVGCRVGAATGSGLGLLFGCAAGTVVAPVVAIGGAIVGADAGSKSGSARWSTHEVSLLNGAGESLEQILESHSPQQLISQEVVSLIQERAHHDAQLKHYQGNPEEFAPEEPWNALVTIELTNVSLLVKGSFDQSIDDPEVALYIAVSAKIYSEAEGKFNQEAFGSWAYIGDFYRYSDFKAEDGVSLREEIASATNNLAQMIVEGNTTPTFFKEATEGEPKLELGSAPSLEPQLQEAPPPEAVLKVAIFETLPSGQTREPEVKLIEYTENYILDHKGLELFYSYYRDRYDEIGSEIRLWSGINEHRPLTESVYRTGDKIGADVVLMYHYRQNYQHQQMFDYELYLFDVPMKREYRLDGDQKYYKQQIKSLFEQVILSRQRAEKTTQGEKPLQRVSVPGSHAREQEAAPAGEPLKVAVFETLHWGQTREPEEKLIEHAHGYIAHHKGLKLVYSYYRDRYDEIGSETKLWSGINEHRPNAAAVYRAGAKVGADVVLMYHYRQGAHPRHMFEYEIFLLDIKLTREYHYDGDQGDYKHRLKSLFEQVIAARQ